MMKKMETKADAWNYISYRYLVIASRRFNPIGDKALLVAGDSREVVSS